MCMDGAQNSVPLPTDVHSLAIVKDLCCDPTGTPALWVVIGDGYISSMYGTHRKYGRLTSLAICVEATMQRIMLGCGMEHGSTLLDDLEQLWAMAMIGGELNMRGVKLKISTI